MAYSSYVPRVKLTLSVDRADGSDLTQPFA